MLADQSRERDISPASIEPAVTVADIAEARARIAPYAVRTPLLSLPVLDERVGGRILVKAENLQRIGAFKFRGAYNAIAQVDRGVFPGGVVACSSGNHAQGVAEAARLLGVPSAIVMPHDAPRIKAAGVSRAGGEIIGYDRAGEDRLAIARSLAEDRQAAFIPPYDDPRIIAGQGTVGLEMVEQARIMGHELDAVLVPVSGGGLIAGVGLAVHDTWPDCTVHSVEPVGFDDMARSLAAGQRKANPAVTGSICDALMAEMPGELTFAIAMAHLAGGVVVDDTGVQRAMRFAFEALKLVVEPGGVIALAALLSGQFPVKGRTVGIVLSGGNVDFDTLATAFA